AKQAARGNHEDGILMSQRQGLHSLRQLQGVVIFGAAVVHPGEATQHLGAGRRERKDVAQFERTLIGYLAFARDQAELLRASKPAYGHERELELQTLGALRAASQEAERVRRDVDRFSRREMTQRAARGLSVVAKRSSVSQASFVLRRELRCSHGDTRRAAAFERGCHTSMHLHACRNALTLKED